MASAPPNYDTDPKYRDPDGSINWGKYNADMNAWKADQENQARAAQQPPAGQQPPPAPPAPLPVTPLPPGTGPEFVNPALVQLQISAAQQAANQAYLDERMRLIDQPMLDIEKDRLALEKATQAANQAYQTKQLELQERQLTMSGEQFAASLAEEQRQFDAQLTLQTQQMTQQFGLQQAQITGVYNGAPTLAAQQLTEQQRQFDATQQLERDRLAQQYQLDKARLDQDYQIHQDTLRYQTETRTLDEQFRRDQMALQDKQFQDRLTFDQSQLAEQQRQFNVSASGYLDSGQATLERERFQADEAARAYERAANPARAFENELARAGVTQVGAPTGAMPFGPVSAATTLLPKAGGTGGALPFQTQGPESVPGYGTQPPPGAPGTQPPPVSAATSLITSPAVVNAFKTGTMVPTAGQIQAPNTLSTPEDAAITEGQVRMANLKSLVNYTPDQAAIVGSYARAGGVSDTQQQYYHERGKPRSTSVQSSYAYR